MDKKNKTAEPLVVLAGRKNVGKSSLFNRFIEEKKAIISPIAGTTRDANYGHCLWRGKKILLADTAGFDKIKKNTLGARVAQYSLKIIKKANLVLFLVDGQTGIVPEDRLILKTVRQFNRPIVFVANKIDNQKLRTEVTSRGLEKLGLGNPLLVSAVNGSGTGDLLDKILKLIKIKDEEETEKIIKIAILGQPNVGKSSLLNQLLGSEEVITSEIAQTTLEPQERKLDFENNPILLIDTAGFKKWTTTLEKIIIQKSLQALEKADIALLVLDINSPITRRDLKLVDLINEKQKPVLVVANKIDLMDTFDQEARTQLASFARDRLLGLKQPIIIFISAKTGSGIKKILPEAIKLYNLSRVSLPENELKNFIKKITAWHRPIHIGGKRPKIYDFQQSKVSPPEFTVTIGKNDFLTATYIKYIENQLRKKFNLWSTPLRLIISNQTARLDSGSRQKSSFARKNKK